MKFLFFLTILCFSLEIIPSESDIIAQNFGTLLGLGPLRPMKKLDNCEFDMISFRPLSNPNK